MPLNKPYYRIYRSLDHGDCDYVKDDRYADNRLQLSRAYLNMEEKLKEIFEYVEPDEDNGTTFSFELYNLFLRASTEVESNFTQILQANNYTKKKWLKMENYYELEEALKLSEYKLYLPFWTDKKNNQKGKNLTPFQWIQKCNKNGKQYGVLQWYNEYNSVKHNREQMFNLANLNNCIISLSAILVLLYAQFGPYCIETYGISGEQWKGDIEHEFDENVIFEFIEKPKWSDDDMYSFRWDNIKQEENPFVPYFGEKNK